MFLKRVSEACFPKVSFINMSHFDAICLYAKRFELLNPSTHSVAINSNLQQEIERGYVLQNLKQYLNVLCVRAGLHKAPAQAFERWRFVESTHSTGPDPVIPSSDGINGLVQELEKSNLSTRLARQICSDLARACREDVKLAAVCQTVCKKVCKTVGKTDKVEIKKGAIWRVQLPGEPALFVKDSTATTLHRKWQSKDQSDFPTALFQLLHRYKMVEGIGYQMALPTDLFKCLAKDFGVSHECFASPLNHYFKSYNSAFPDVDIPFGSKGSFFDFYPEEGSFEVNPPFIEEILAATVARVLALLTRAEEAKKPLSFILFTSAWEDTPGIMWATKSSFCRKHSRMRKGKHSYKRGDQHLHKRPYMRAGADSFVFFLQTTQGAKKWGITDRKLRHFHQAWE